eukprot:jgi/Ulvmu1/5340/UM022_0134.1
MSSKKIAHKRKLGEQGAHFTSGFANKVNSALETASGDDSAKRFLSALTELQQHQLVHAQLDALPPVCKALTAALGKSCDYSESQTACIHCAVLLLFQPCSTHLHQPLTAALAPHIRSNACTEQLRSAIACALDMHERRPKVEGSNPITHIPSAPAWAALLRAAPQQPALQQLATKLLQQLAEQLHAAMEQISAGAHASPQLSEDVQAAISAQYTTLQKFGSDVSSASEGAKAVGLTADSLVLVLSGCCVLREPALSAAAALWSAALLPAAAPAALAAVFVHGLVRERVGSAAVEVTASDEAACGNSFVQEHWHEQGSSIEAKLSSMQPIGRACAIRALAACIPAAALCVPATLKPPESTNTPRPWHLLVDGLIEEAAAIAHASADGQTTFNSMAALTAGLGRAAVIHQKPEGCEEHAGADGTGRATGKVDEGDTSAQRAHGSTQHAWSLAPSVISEQCVDRVLDLVVVNMEERLKITTHQGSQAFAAVCSAAAAQAARRRAGCPTHGAAAAAGGAPEAGLASLERAVERLIALPATAKGRYSLLAVLVPHVGARCVLRQRPALVCEAMHALREETCTAATQFLKELLQQLRQEIGDEAGGEGDRVGGAVGAWREHWVGPLVDALRVEDALFRGRVVSYALPMLLDLDPESLPVLLRLLQGGDGGTSGCSAAAVGPTVAVLLAARGLNLFSSLDAVVEDEGGRCHVPWRVLCAAAVHEDEQLRQQALELAALHAKSSVAPGQTELDIVKRQLILTMRTTSSPAHNKLAVVLEKLIARIRMAALGAQQRRAARERAARAGAAQPGSAQRHVAAVHRRLIFVSRQQPGTEEEQDAAEQARLQTFLQWLMQHLCDSLYAGAPHARRHFALRGLHILLAAFQHDRWLARPLSGDGRTDDGALRAALHERHKRDTDALRQLDTAATVSARRFQPFVPEIHSAGLVQVLLSAAVDSWAPLRASVLAALRALPKPLCGLEEAPAVKSLARWALSLLRSPRPFEAAAAAQLLSLLHDGYVLGLAWRIQVHPDVAVAAPGSTHDGEVVPEATTEPSVVGTQPQEVTVEEARRAGVVAPAGIRTSIAFLASVVQAIEAAVALAEGNMAAACRESFLQGKLLLLQAVLSAFPWTAAMSLGHEVVQTCRGLLERTLAGLYRAAELCAPYLDGRYNVDAADVSEGDAMADVGAALEAGGASVAGRGDVLGPEVTLLIAGSWCTVKEIAATLATLITRVPIVSETPPAAADAQPPASHAATTRAPSTGYLSNTQVRNIGEYFVDSLCTLKHNGATRKLEQRFELVCKRLLQQQDAALAALPHAWLLRVLSFLQRPGQTRSDIVRRSAGIPSAVVAACQAEPAGAAKQLLPIALRKLLDAAQGPAASGEPWPLVHAFNCLRTIFESSALALDAAAVFAEGIEVSIHGMSADEWEVRNTATLTYVVLVTRVHGFKNASSPTAQRAMTTAQGFMAAFPRLHPFLLAQLGAAVSHTEAAPGAAPHASLLPIIMLLTRLQPSGGTARAAGGSVPDMPLEPFRALVTRCLHVPGFAVREQAASALAVLHTPATLPAALGALLRMLPQSKGQLRDFRANSVHGALMAMEQIVLRAVPAASEGERAQALGVLGAALPDRLWLADAARTTCPGVSRSFVHLLGACCGTAAVAGASDTLRAVLGAAVVPHCYAPMYALWLESAVRVRLQVLAADGATDEEQAAAAVAALEHPVAEVRAAALQWLEEASVAAAWPRTVAETVSGAVWAALRNRDSAAATGAKLSVLQTMAEKEAIAPQDPAGEQAHSVVPACHSAPGADAVEATPATPEVSWEATEARLRQVESAAAAHSTASVTLSALQYRAAVFGQWLKGRLQRCDKVPQAAMADDAPPARVAGQLLSEATACARPSELEASRRAAAATLRVSGVLRLCLAPPDGKQPSNADAAVVATALRAWGLAVQLIEDEDDAVRDSMARAMGAVVEEHHRGSSRSAALPGLFASAADAASFASTSCAECVLRLSFAMLTACFRTHPAFHDWLVACVAGHAGPVASSTAARPGRRLFDREADNHHCDAVLVAQLAACCLHECAAARGGVAQPLWRRLCAAAEEQLAAGRAAAEGAADASLSPWLDEAAFVPAFRGLLLAQAAAVATSALGGPSSDSSISALQATIAQLAGPPGGGSDLGHPILCNGQYAVLGLLRAAAAHSDGAAAAQAQRDPLLFLAC